MSSLEAELTNFEIAAAKGAVIGFFSYAGADQARIFLSKAYALLSQGNVLDGLPELARGVATLAIPIVLMGWPIIDIVKYFKDRYRTNCGEQ